MYEQILEKYSPEKENLLYILHEIQDNHAQHYISEEAVHKVAEYLKIEPAHIFGVLTFYTMFSTEPRGSNIIRLCESPPCFHRGAENILRYLEKSLQISAGETTTDGLFTLELAACLGVCGNAPVMMINEDVYGDLGEARVDEIIKSYKGAK
jgi:NADH-quinone oxidoreductase E subunit